MRHRLVLAAASVYSFLALPLVTVADEVDTVLDRAEAALGGEGVLGDIETVRIHSHGIWEMQSRGVPATKYEAVSVFGRPNRARVLWKLPPDLGGEFTFGYDGENAWGIWGAPPARCKGWHGAVISYMAEELKLFLTAPGKMEHSDSFAQAAATGPGDRGLVALTYRPFAVAEPWKVWFDRQSGHIVRLEHDSYHMDGQPILGRITRGEPRDFGGLNYPSQARFEAIRDDKVLETADETIDHIELNPELPDDFFVCPKWEVDTATIGMKDIPAETVVKCEYRGPYQEMGPSVERLMKVVLAAGMAPTGPPTGTYLREPASPRDQLTEIAVRVAPFKEGEPKLSAGYTLAQQPALRVAYAYHLGDYTNEGEAHARVGAWLAQQGLKPTGPPRAIWFHDPQVTVAEDLVTEVQVPVQEETPAENTGGQFHR